MDLTSKGPANGYVDEWLNAEAGIVLPRGFASFGKGFMSSIEAECLRLIDEAAVPGMASAIIRDGRLERHLCRGQRGEQAPAPVDEHTVFDAASLSKPVFAHAVLQLVDQEYLSLDAPLGGYLPNYVPTDPLVSLITLRARPQP
jgi:CubicO group peptidase (beta-lactamase class C family)